jgi:hypothetical protein
MEGEVEQEAAGVLRLTPGRVEQMLRASPGNIMLS